MCCSQIYHAPVQGSTREGGEEIILTDERWMALSSHINKADIQLERGHILVYSEQTEGTGNEKEQLSDRTGYAQLGLRRL